MIGLPTVALQPIPQPLPKPGQMKAVALALAADRGWYVHPLNQNAKTPASEHGQKDATTDPARIERLWQPQTFANVGVNTEMSGLLVIDLDVHTEGVDGIKRWAELTAVNAVPETLTVQTGSGGVHIYFQMPDPMIPNSAGKLGQNEGEREHKVSSGIDVRGNGYVVAPGSRVNGHGYVILTDHPVAPCPAWIVEALKPKARPVYDYSSGEQATQDEVLQRVQELADELEATPDGSGNDTANRNAFKAGGYVGAGQIPEHHVISVFLDAVSGWSWSKPEDFKTMCNTIERAVSDGAQSPRPWERARSGAAPFGEADVIDADQDDASGPVVSLAGSTSWEDTKKALAQMGFQVDQPEAGDYFTDTRMAQQFVQFRLKFKDGSPRYVYTVEHGWLKWSGVVWKPVQGEAVVAVAAAWTSKQTERAVQQAEQMLKDAVALAMADPDNAQEILKKAAESGQALIKGWRNRLAIVRLQAVVTLGKGMMMTDGNQFDQNPDILNTPSGVVDLTTGALRPGLPGDRCMKITDVDYVPGATHPDWDLALQACPDAETREWLRIFFGQATTGYPNREDRMVLLHGDGSNGKSLVMGAVAESLGGYFTFVSDRALVGDASVHPTELMDFFGARLAVLEETQEAHHLDTQRLKKLVGTPKIKARKIAKDSMEFKATHSLMINTNHLPTVKESDHGTWRRLLAIPFPYTYRKPGEALQSEWDRTGDLGLKQRLMGTDQRRAVLAWLVSGAVSWYQHGQTMPPETAAITWKTNAWRSENDVVMGFLESEVFHLVPGSHVQSSDLLNAVNDYLTERGHRAWTEKLLKSRLESHDLLKGKVFPKRIKAGSRESESISLHGQQGTTRFTSVGPVAFGNKPTVGQYTAWSGLAFRPLTVVAQPAANDMFGS